MVGVAVLAEHELPEAASAAAAVRVIAGGLYAALVRLSDDDVLVPVPGREPEDWQDVLERSLAAASQRFDHPLGDAGPVALMRSSTPWSASWLLMLERLLAPDAAYGALVAVPSRSDLVVGSLCVGADADAIVGSANYVSGMAIACAVGQPAPLSADLYWWHDGSFERLAVVGDGSGSSQLRVTPGFAALLDARS